ncbi:MAG: hypothetical protein ABI200_07845 [Gaiellales bacterium]
MTDPTYTAPDLDASQAEDVAESAHGTNVSADLRTRVVREARRETWFVVNEGSEELATIPIDLHDRSALRRVEVNGEAAEFSASPDQVLVRPRRILRPGAGTLIILHFR